MAKTKNLPKSRAPRRDGWENTYTGMGILGRDKRLGGTFAADVITQREAEEIWTGDDIAARIIETIPDEMLRAGHCPKVEGDKDLTELMESEGDRLNLTEVCRRALYYARAYGGAGVLMGADDGSKDLSLPLAEDRIRSFDWLNVLTPQELQPVKYYSDPRAARYGEISVYRIVPLDTPPDSKAVGEMPLVHESRIVRFGGVATSRGATLRNINPGWDNSILVRIQRIVNDFQDAWAGAAILLNDFAPPVLKIKGLAKVLASASGDSLSERARSLELSRSIARTIILDSEEEWSRQTTNVTGLGDLLEKLMLRLAAAANMPVSLLMGQSPAGLNATGDSDIRWFYDQVRARQDRHLEPALKRLYTVAFLNRAGPAKGKVPENWEIEFEPLWQMTALEEAQVRKTQAETDVAYITAQVVTPQEIARSRFGGDGWSSDTHIDVDLRDELLDDEELQLKALGAVEDPAVVPVEGDPNAGPPKA